VIVRWLLERLGPSGEPGWRENLVALRRVLLVHTAARSVLSSALVEGASVFANGLYALTALAALAGLWPKHARRATAACLVLVLAETVRALPLTANHVFLELVVLALFALLDERREEDGPLLLASLRWTTAIMFFYTGLQKLLWGWWTRGELLAFLAGTEDRFAATIGKLMPAEELARLRSFNEKLIGPGRWQPRTGAGPYRVDSVLWVTLSNFVWIFEIGAGLALLVRRLFVPAALAVIAVVVLIEVGAREITFGLLMLNLLLVYLPGAWNRRLFPWTAAAYGWLVAAHFGLLPMFEYSAA
jgi:uncharacterized membrane protein YphA (DoxX/SURF4 family)